METLNFVLLQKIQEENQFKSRKPVPLIGLYFKYYSILYIGLYIAILHIRLNPVDIPLDYQNRPLMLKSSAIKVTMLIIQRNRANIATDALRQL